MILHPNARTAIIAKATAGIPHILVKNGMFLDRFSSFMSFYSANGALPKNGKLHDELVDQVGDHPFINFATDVLSNELLLRDKYESGDVQTKLIEMEGYGDAASLATRLVDEFESLPWHYSLTIKLEDCLPPLPDDATIFPVTDSARLIKSDLLLSEEFPLDPENEATKNKIFGGQGLLALIPEEPKWDGSASYLQIFSEGFVGPYGGGGTMDNVERNLKSFIGLGIALKLFVYKYKHETYPIRLPWIVHRKHHQGWIIDNRLDLDIDDARVLKSIALWNAFGVSYNEEHKVPWLQSVLKRVGESLRAPRSESLKLAAQWFFDSFKGSDEVLSYVRRMTSLEILFGERADTTKSSIGELIGNRIAYLIGKTHQERLTILSDFRQIYGIRSKILHHGKHRFQGDERTTMGKLQSLCERALDAEAKLLASDVETTL